jgi:uncharacterized protein
MAKPVGADCNLRCDYCYYLEKNALYPTEKPRCMDCTTLESYVRSYIECNPRGSVVSFVWQGGEPCLAGIDFYRKAVELQRRYGTGKVISNSFQTNGVLLDDAFCRFLKKNNFFVGLSLDGPANVHDEHRKTMEGEPTHHLVMRALRLLQKHGIEYNILACVNRCNSAKPYRVYEFFKDAGVKFIQFQPVVERDASGDVTEWSVSPEGYGRFLSDIFDIWVTNDVGKIFVMNFEWALANYMGKPGAACHHRPTCGRSVIVEHNGDVYSCDRYVLPENLLGNVNETPLSRMLDSCEQEKFGTSKYENLPKSCRKCPVFNGCFGGCKRHRFVTGDGGDLNYLCSGLRGFFTHITPQMQIMKRLIDAGSSVDRIMDMQII